MTDCSGSEECPKDVGMTPWVVLAHLTGFVVVTSSLAHLPPGTLALDHFDNIKRVILSLLPPFILVWSLFDRRSVGTEESRIEWITLLLMLWMVGRQFAHDVFWREWDVTVGWLFPFLYFWVGLKLPSRTWRICAIYLAASGSIQILLMGFQYLGRDPWLGEAVDSVAGTPSARMIGTIGYQNQAAAFVALCVGAFWHTSGRLWCMIGFLVGGAMIVALTGSRGALIAIVIAAGVSLWTRNRREIEFSKKIIVKKNTLGVLVILALIGLMVVLPVTRARFSLLTDPLDPDAGIASRLLLQRVAGNMWMERPWFGWGGGAYAYQYVDRLGDIMPEIKAHRDLRSVVFAREAHNTYLQVAAEFGLIGLLLWAVWGLLLVRLFWRSRRPAPQAAGLGIFTIVYLAVHALVSFPWQMSLAGPIAAFMLGTASRNCTGPTKQDDHACSGGCLTRIGTVLLLGWSVLTIAHSITHLHLSRAAMRLESTDDVARFLDRIPPWGHRYTAWAGAWMAQMRDFDQAISLLEEAATGYTDIWLLNNLGHVYSQLGAWDAARNAYDRWVASGIDHQNALHNLSVVYENAGYWAKSLDTLERQRRLWWRRDISGDIRYAAVAIRAERPDIARGTLDVYIIDQLPIGPRIQILNLLGVAELMEGEIEQGRNRFQDVLALDPNHPVALRNLRAIAPD